MVKKATNEKGPQAKASAAARKPASAAASKQAASTPGPESSTAPAPNSRKGQANSKAASFQPPLVNGKTSSYRGVTYFRPTSKWRAQVSASGKTTSLGDHDTEEEAATAYDRAIINKLGRDAITNFPMSVYEKDIDDLMALDQTDLVNVLRSKARKIGQQSSHFRGVSLLRQTSKWHAQINVNCKQVHLGYFNTEEQAARAYDRAAINKGAKKDFKGKIFTNFDISDYTAELDLLRRISQQDLVQALSAEGKRKQTGELLSAALAGKTEAIFGRKIRAAPSKGPAVLKSLQGKAERALPKSTARNPITLDFSKRKVEEPEPAAAIGLITVPSQPAANKRPPSQRVVRKRNLSEAIDNGSTAPAKEQQASGILQTSLLARQAPREPTQRELQTVSHARLAQKEPRVSTRAKTNQQELQLPSRARPTQPELQVLSGAKPSQQEPRTPSRAKPKAPAPAPPATGKRSLFPDTAEPSKPAAEKAAPAPTASLLGAPASTDLAELYRARAYARYANFLTPQTSAKPTTAPSPAADPEPKEDDKDAGKDATPSEEAAVSMKAVQSPPKRQRTATRRLQRPANAPPASGAPSQPPAAASTAKRAAVEAPRQEPVQQSKLTRAKSAERAANASKAGEQDGILQQLQQHPVSMPEIPQHGAARPLTKRQEAIEARQHTQAAHILAGGRRAPTPIPDEVGDALLDFAEAAELAELEDRAAEGPSKKPKARARPSSLDFKGIAAFLGGSALPPNTPPQGGSTRRISR